MRDHLRAGTRRLGSPEAALPDDLTDKPVDQLLGVAGILAATDPGAWRKLLSEHIADSSGHCRSCPTSSGASPVWPCGLRMIGELAERLSAQQTPRSAGRSA